MFSDVIKFDGIDLAALGRKISRGGNLNIKAVQNHLGLDRKLAERLDGVISVIDRRKASLIISLGNSSNLQVTEIPVACDTMSNQVHGIHVSYDGIIRLVVPYSAVEKTAPRTGHAVYIVAPASMSKMDAITPENLVPQYVLNPPHVGRIPFEMLVKNRVPVYIGKTSRGVAVRAMEHLISAFRNPQTRFHRAVAGNNKTLPMTMSFMLVGSYQNELSAYQAEENEIRKASELDGVYLLNTMFSRQAFDELQKLDKAFKNVAPEDAEEILARRSAATSKNWDDPEYAEAVICNNERNFDADDVRLIRMIYRLTGSANETASRLGLNSSRVKRLIEGVTYRRVL